MKKIEIFLIDTNIILRFLIGDVPTQLEKAKKLFKRVEDKEVIGLMSILVINELLWILEHFYNKERKEFIPQILKLLSLKDIKILEIKKSDLIIILENMEETNLDFTDLYLLHLGKKAGQQIFSFDKKLVKS